MARDELARLILGPEPGQEVPAYFRENILVYCDGSAAAVLARTREVLAVVLKESPAKWPSDEEWATKLPKWFVDKCRPPYSQAELSAMERRTYEEKLQDARNETNPWVLDCWVYWFLPENRYWLWLDAKVESADLVIVTLEVQDFPFPWAALSWLLRASGANEVESET